MCEKRNCSSLLNHLVRPRQYVGRNRQADLLGGLEVNAAATDLRDWRSVRVSGSGSFPSHLSASSRSIDANTWPTGHDIGQLLSKWHSMLFDTQRAFERIPFNQRAGIRPPPG